MIHLTTAWTPEYEPLARITYPGKQHYCNKWGHKCDYKSHIVDKKIGATFRDLIKPRADHWLEKISNIPEDDFMWFTGCDTLITNPSIDIQTYVDNDFDIIAANDCNCINTDSMLVKSNERTKTFFQKIINGLPNFKEEQEAFNTYLSPFEEYREFLSYVGWDFRTEKLHNNIQTILNSTPVKFKLVKQKCFNAYCLDHLPTNLKYPIQTDGTSWEPTDLMLHMPGQSLEYRLRELPPLIPEEHKGLPFIV